MRRKQFQLFRFTLFVENIDSLQPSVPAPSRSAHPDNTASSVVVRRSSNSFNQRPVGVIFAILDSMVRTQKNILERIVSRGCWPPQEAGLHYIAIFDTAVVAQGLLSFIGRKTFESPSP